MATYGSSTQQRFWTFSAANLQAARSIRFAQSVEIAIAATTPGAEAGGAREQQPIAGTKRPRSEIESTGSNKRAKLDALVAAGDEKTGGYLSMLEEQRLLAWAQLELLRLCREADFDRAVTAAAAMFLMRFFVRGLLVQYPPQEMIPPAIFLAIKAEACQYTEFEPLARRLTRFDADLRARVHAIMLAHGVTALEDRASASRASADDIYDAHDELSPWHLTHEVPLLLGLQAHTATHQAYRPLKALLLDCVGDYAAMAGEMDGGTVSGSHSDPHPLRARIAIPFHTDGAARGNSLLRTEDAAFVQAWNAVQARAFQFSDAALLSDAPLRFSPAHIAAASLILACRNSAVYDSPPLLPAPGTEAFGEGQGQEELGVTGSAQSHGAPATLTLLPALAQPPPNSVSWWGEPWTRAFLSGAGGAGRVGAGTVVAQQAVHAEVDACLDMIVQALRALPSIRSCGPPLLCSLEMARDASQVEGTAAYEERLASLRAAREAYKRGKEARGKEAKEAFEQAVRSDKETAGVHKPVIVPLGEGHARR